MDALRPGDGMAAMQLPRSSMRSAPQSGGARVPTQSVGTRAREAFTLLEIIVALAIFVGALAIVSKLVELGTRHALYAQLHTRAIVLAQSKMAELEAGIVPLQASTAEVFEDDPAWQWQTEITSGPFNGLKHVILTVWPTPGGDVGQTREPVQFQLQRWLFDPAYRDSLDEDASSTTPAGGNTTSPTTPNTGDTP